MSITKPKKISSTLLGELDHKVLSKLLLDSGACESQVLRGLIRFSLKKWKEKKIDTLEVMRLGAYSQS